MQATISELRPGSKQVDLVFKVVEKQPVREVTNKFGQQLRVCDLKVGDASGTIVLTLWNEDIDKMEEGKVYELKNGYTTVFQNHLRLSKGKYGELADSEQEVEVNTANDMSAAEHENPRRGRY